LAAVVESHELVWPDGRQSIAPKATKDAERAQTSQPQAG